MGNYKGEKEMTRPSAYSQKGIVLIRVTRRGD